MRANVVRPIRGATNAPETWLVSRPSEAGTLWVAFCIALVIHALALLISLPRPPGHDARLPQQHNLIVVKKYVPPPPRIEPRRAVAPRKKTVRRVPVPDPTPDAPEPIREAAPFVRFEGPVTKTGYMLGSPAPPVGNGPAGSGSRVGPVLAGVGGVTQPQRIEESYVRPDYPELARRARIEGRVVLSAVIHGDGTVGEAHVLSCSLPGVGFEQAAIDAVQCWRYRPATLDGVPVDVFFTVLVEFELS